MLQFTNHRKGVTVCMNANNEVGERLGEADLVVFCRATKNRQNTFASSIVVVESLESPLSIHNRKELEERR